MSKPQKKLLVAIANFGISQLNYLSQTLLNIQNFSFEKQIVIDTTCDISSLLENHHTNIITRKFDSSIATALPFQHRAYFAEHLDDFDFFLFTENDILIPQHAIDFILQHTAYLDCDEIIGFCRYESKGEYLYLTDQNVQYPLTHYKAWQEKNQLYFTPSNMHSGCYLLTKNQLRKAIISGGYLVRPHTSPYGMLEQGASDIYTQCGFKPKFLPLPIEPVLVHHLPDKYVNSETAMPNFNTHVLSVLSEKPGTKPQLTHQNKAIFPVRAVIKIKYHLARFERKFRRWVRGYPD